MTQPTTYDRQYDFQAFQASTPSDPLPAAQIASELNAVKQTLDELLANLALIQRDDTAIANNSVGFDQFKGEVSTGVNPATGWATATAYAIGDAVFDTLKLYRCLVSHTSGTFATDLVSVYWLEIEDFTATANSAATTTYDNGVSGLAAADVKAALDEIVVEKLDLVGGTMSGVIAMGTSKITGLGDGTALQDAATVKQVQSGIVAWADAGGAVDAITATYTPTILATPEGTLLGLRAAGANVTTTPTFSPDGITARTIVKENGQALVAGDIAGDGHDLMLRYDLANTQWVLLNPQADAAILAISINNVVEDTTPQAGGDFDMNGNQMKWAKGADVVSGTALPVLTDGNYFDVTGATTVTSIDTCGGDGTIAPVIKLHFDAALILTHHATNLILPGGANITTAAGDEAEFVEYASGTWRCTEYTKADGTALVTSETAGWLESKAEQTPSAAASVVAEGLTGRTQEIVFQLKPATDGAELYLTVGHGGTPTYLASTIYTTMGEGRIQSSGAKDWISAGVAQILLNHADGVGFAANEWISGRIVIYNFDEADYSFFSGAVSYNDTAGLVLMAVVGGQIGYATNALTAIKLAFSSGNIAEGYMTVNKVA